MPDTPTPGQVAYAVYRQRLQRGPYELRPWALLARRHQHAWEAAAQAVLDAWQAQPRLEDGDA